MRYVVDADIKAYFDTVNHQWLQKFLSHRIADSTIHRLVGKWLRSGVMENGVVCRGEEGTPQGGPISPLRANIYLHYVLDLWFIKKFRPRVKGACELVRYADDFVVCFENREEAVRFLKELRERFEQFHLSVSDEKTQIVQFGKTSQLNGESGPTENPRTFDFLGFTHYMRMKGKRGYRVARKPSSKSRNKFLRNVKSFVEQHRDRNVWWQAYRLKPRLQGYYNYFGLRHCKRALQNVKWHTERIWVCELRKRSQRHKLHWSKMRRYPWFHILPEPSLR
jgi:RNA-directed DNA polymerase